MPCRSRPVPNASPIRRIESSSSLPLALDLVDVRLELLGHRVELLTERRELVVALDGHALAEVATAQPARRLQEVVDLALQRAHDEHGRGQR